MPKDNPLGRIQRHDPQSRRYAVSVTPTPGKSVRHSMNAPNVDQFYLGACVGFSGTNMLNCSMAVRSRAKFNSIVKYDKAGTTYLSNNDGIENYHWATVYDPYPGEYPPSDEGSSAIGLMTWWKQVGIVTGYDWAFSFDQFLAALQRQPVLVGTEWFDSMMEPDDVGVLHPGGRSAGGHEYLATQINWPRRHIGFENSWGEAWGVGGRFYMTFDDFEALLADGGDAVAPRFL